VRTWLCYAGLQRSCLTHPWSLASRLIRAMIISSFWRGRAAHKRSFPATGTCTTSWIRYRQCCCLALSSIVSRRNQCRLVSPNGLQAGSRFARSSSRTALRRARAGCPAGPFAVAREGSPLRQRKRSSIEARRLSRSSYRGALPGVRRGRAVLKTSALQRLSYLR